MTTTRRNSRQRTLVYQVVKDSHSHPNAEEVYLLVRRQLPDISLGTVYRNLNLLVQPSTKSRFEPGEFATVANKIIRKKMNINHNFKKKGGFRV